MNSLSLSNIEKSYTNSESWFDHLDGIAGPKLHKYLNKDKISMFRVGASSNKDELSLIQRVLYDDIVYQFPDALLTKVDVASMAASLEVRSPFLNKQLVELTWTLPDNFKLRWGERKYLLKKLAKSYLPKEVIYRPKMGFGIPISEWFKSDLGDYGLSVFKESVAEELGYIKKHTFEKTLLEHKKSNLEATRLWLLLWLELWFKSLKV
jgi:asparagine synthase (glutamine-hydrolysing)